jgi:hypothetical protein
LAILSFRQKPLLPVLKCEKVLTVCNRGNYIMD